jgi:hypothetical protein
LKVGALGGDNDHHTHAFDAMQHLFAVAAK